MDIILTLLGACLVIYLIARIAITLHDDKVAIINAKANQVAEKERQKDFEEYKKNCEALYYLLGEDAQKIICNERIREKIIYDLCEFSKPLFYESMPEMAYDSGIKRFLSDQKAEMKQISIIVFHLNITASITSEQLKKYLSGLDINLA